METGKKDLVGVEALKFLEEYIFQKVDRNKSNLKIKKEDTIKTKLKKNK